MEFQIIVNFLDIESDDKNFPNLLLKNGLKFMINKEEITMLTKMHILL